LRELCDRHGILLVLDEVQSGIGRTGKFWAFEHDNIVPDIVASAKGLGSGMPIGACIARKNLTENWLPGAHGSTYSGNALACAAAYETLCLVEEGMMQNAADVGAYLIEQLQALAEHTPHIGEVRGRGLMVGVEFVKDRTTREPDHDGADAVMDEAFRRGVLLLTCGKSTIRFCPPLIATREQVDTAIDVFEAAINHVYST
jgi:4-aminobutyrate aminotransferase